MTVYVDNYVEMVDHFFENIENMTNIPDFMSKIFSA